MGLCDLCNGLMFAKLYPPNYYEHAANMAALEASAENCPLCKMLQGPIEKGRERSNTPELHFSGATDEYWYHKVTNEARYRCSVKLQIFWHAKISNVVYCRIGIWMKSKFMVNHVPLAMEKGDKLILKSLAFSYIHGCYQLSETPSQGYFEVLKRCLNECETNHSNCDNDIPRLPTRIVCVTEDGHEPYLANGEGKHARYATLSHCWGGSTSAMTTLKNLQEHQKAISLNGLPKTFKDAVIICRQLGILYLWIDRLCIVQDSPSDWERESGAMGSIFYDSTLTLAAAVSYDSLGGIFCPQRHDVLPLPASFSNKKVQAYLIDYNKPDTGNQLRRNILQTRGWVMQEMYLARRILHFLQGGTILSCSNGMESVCRRISYGGERLKYGSLQANLKTFAKACQRPWVLMVGCNDAENDEEEDTGEEEDKGEEKDNGEEISSNLPHAEADTANGSDHGRGSNNKDVVLLDMNKKPLVSVSASALTCNTDEYFFDIVDLRDPLNKTSSPPMLVGDLDDELDDCLDEARRHTIYHIWYELVETYSARKLTYASDKLPAMAGIAAHIQAITYDQYLAGHWRRELERSLFWCIHKPSGKPCVRVKEYRAPSWSWASIDGEVGFGFADLSPNNDTSAAVEILDATTVVNGDNKFGHVSSARLLIKASILTTAWNADYQGWLLSGSYKTFKAADFEWEWRGLKLVDMNGLQIGKWSYDDEMNGLLPGSPLSRSSSEAEIIARRVSDPDRNWADDNLRGEDLITLMEKRGTYVPEELILVKGPTRKFSEVSVKVLVLARAENETEAYRRVGAGELTSWDESVERVEVLTLV